jgi:hypothetical protein
MHDSAPITQLLHHYKEIFLRPLQPDEQAARENGLAKLDAWKDK